MKLTESMRRAGWRECPDDTTRDQWYAMGGYWQTIGKDAHNGQLYNDVMMPPQRFMQAYDTITRPINAKTLDYDPRGWGEQPAPVTVAESVCVWDVLDRMIQDACVRNPNESCVLKEVHAILYARYQVGLAEYGQPLMTHDGRDSTKDLSDEVADAWMYGMKLILEGREREGSLVMDLFIRAQNLIRVEASNGKP